LSNEGTSLIQMPNALGLRSQYHLLRRGFQKPRRFDVHYYTLTELLNTFKLTIGPSKITVDGFFGLNMQASDAKLMPARYRTLISASELLRRCSQTVSILKLVADSLYIESKKGQ